jgi:hypothetical protein
MGATCVLLQIKSNIFKQKGQVCETKYLYSGVRDPRLQDRGLFIK